MKQYTGHITLKVVMGYILLIIIAICSVAYIYHVIVRMADVDEPDTASRQKVYLITGALTLLYESETINQLIGTEKNGYTRYNATLNRAQRNIDSLRVLVTDSVQRLKIDTIDNLIERKRRNTRRLLEAMTEANAEHLYRVNIEKIIATQDTVVEQKRVEESVVVKQDTVVVPKKPKGFFRRLAEAFSPSKQDSGIIVNTTRHIQKDTVVETYNPADTIVSVLKSIQDSVAGQRKELDKILLQRVNNLRYDNSVITQKINQMLRDIEQEEMNKSLNRVQQKQHLMKQTSQTIAFIAIASFLIAVVFLLFIWRDVSRSLYYRRQLEKAKQYAEDLLHVRERLMLTISHDIRAPLSSIIGYIELLQHFGMSEREQYYLRNMTGSAEHILALVNNLLDFHRLESKQMEIHPVPFNVGGLFKEIYDSFKPIADNKGLEFVFVLKDGAKGRQQYLGDTIRIRQIAGNLLSNAIKFTSEGRVVLVVDVTDRSASAGTLCFRVADAGPGIPEAEQEKIFGEFARLSSAEKEEGFGLGLSITRKLIELMQGTLSLESARGKGSTFTVGLPLPLTTDATELALPEQQELERPAAPERDICCLLVDDDPLQLTMTHDLLQRNHVRVVCCQHPQDVLPLLAKQPVDMVVTDIQMPGLDGFALLKTIRESALPNAATIPVIALSASLANEKDHYLAAGFTGFLNKPFTAKQLLTLIGELLSLPQGEVKELDFSSLTAFAGEDPEDSARILRTFCDETGKSILLLREALVASNRGKAAKVAHKLIPLMSMLGSSTLVFHLRKLEENDPGMPPEEWRELLAQVASMAMQVVESVESRLGE